MMADDFKAPIMQTGMMSKIPQLWAQVSTLLLIIFELCWILPWFNMVTQITDTAPMWVTGFVLGSIMLVSYIIAALLEGLRIIRSMQFILLGAVLMGCLVVAESVLLFENVDSLTQSFARLDPGSVLILFFVIWMYWRGISIVQTGIRPSMVWRRFELGILFFMAYIFISGRIEFSIPDFPIFILFLMAGLFSVVITRIDYVGLTKGATKNPFDINWLSSVGTVIGIVVFLSAFIGWLLSGQFRPLLNSIVELVRYIAAVVIFVIGIPGLLISMIIYSLIPWFKNLSLSDKAFSLPEFPIFGSDPDFVIQDQALNITVNLQAVIFWGLILLLVVVIIVRFSRTNRRKLLFEVEEPESLLEEGDAQRLILKNIQEAFELFVGMLKPNQYIPVQSRVRRIYQQVLQLSAELNKPRQPQKTPLEFLPELGEIFPRQIDGLMKITLLYNQVRYGELPENVSGWTELDTAWRNIKTESRGIKRFEAGKLNIADGPRVEREHV